MNEHDSEVISGMLTQRGYMEMPAAAQGDPDIIIINTCSIRDNADQRFFGTLGQLKKIKARKPDFAVCVCGCMMQQEHITERIRRSYPWVDVIFGTHNIHEFPDMLEEQYLNPSIVSFQPIKHFADSLFCTDFWLPSNSLIYLADISNKNLLIRLSWRQYAIFKFYI